MVVDAEHLFFQPFRAVIALGNAAVNNAATVANQNGDPHEDSEMFRAASALVGEGERGLSRVQTVWEAQVDRFGETFKEMTFRNGSIETRRLKLEDMLWDFDEYITPDGFNGERFYALQVATKLFAFDLSETAERFQLSTVTSQISAVTSFPPLPPLPPQPTKRPDPRRGSHGSKPAIALESINVGPSESKPIKEQKLAAGEEKEEGNQGRTPTKESHPSWLLSVDPAQNPSRITHVSELSDPFAGSPEPIDDDEILLWPELKEDFLAIRHSMQSTETSVSGSTLEAITPTSLLHNSWKYSQGSSVTSLVGPVESTHLDDSSPEARPPRVARQMDCSIGPSSTFRRLKGFCEGATTFRKDGHWDSIVRTSEYSAALTSAGGEMLRASDGIIPFQFEEETKIGKCSQCPYSHDLEEMEQDLQQQPGATKRSDSGARYRLRLLYKSHMRVASSSGARYACLWCVREGTTVREGDATVFLRSEDLLRHIAGHPQPLPTVPGIHVRYGRLSKSDSHGFDLHLPEGPNPIPVPDSVGKLARAVALKDHYVRPGRSSKLERPPKYEGEMLEFLAGAVIVGIMYPEKWDSKWCLGRHDGRFGAFPAKLVEIQPPQESEIPMASGGSGMSVVARWRWPPSGTPSSSVVDTPTGWLPFSKGEVISNVHCVYADYWCWSGTNRQGMTGVFPRTHIDLKTLREQSSMPQVKKRRGFSGLFKRSASTSEA
ncbi:hypothetical protein QBC47DRAFT_389508 [Echria macrotheca]|uniref:SH3 domain-containing protein n=1 Tax=Echria macrotheca TaxID=438768 RepID=A0AAJ0B9W9_9PEZI|nr:hypothetical protein QBC47DRAFT_389508 [Echria macrotheca]